MPRPTTTNVRPRQEPVSCRLCRAKKLRCNRQLPCGNCIARGVTCDRYGHIPLEVTPVQDETGKQAVILDRLQRLEELVQSMNQKTQFSASIATPQSMPSILSARPSDLGVSSEDDSIDLQEVGTREQSVLSDLSHGVTFRISSITTVLHYTTSSGEAQPSSGGARLIHFPTQFEAAQLFDIYFRYIADFHHFVHPVAATTQMKFLYESLDSNRPVKLGHAALLLSIFAASTAVQTAGRNSPIFFLSIEDAKALSVEWSKATYDVLDHSRRVDSGSIEDVQALINVTFLLFNFEGFSARCRVGFSMALAMARDLGLHRVDSTSSKPSSSHKAASGAENEIKRRIWWHLAASDWFIACSGGPTEGVYSVHPKHCVTHLPRHINDDALDWPEVNIPLSEPTSMSYFLQRIKLAEISRDIIDAIPAGSLSTKDISFSDILVLDAKIESFLHELPVFFRSDEVSRRASAFIHHDQIYTTQQRYSIEFMTHTRRCKLHQPYAMRASETGKYAYSREICLQSARQVIELQRQLLQEPDTGIIAMAGNAHHLFFTTIALVMDLCLNKDNDNAGTVTKGEVTEACRMLEEAQHTSPLAQKYVQSLMDTLRKHKVRLTDPTSTAHNQVSVSTVLEVPVSASAEVNGGLSNTLQQATTKEIFEFEDIWEAYVENAQNFDVPEWDQLFNDLDVQWT